MKYIQSAGGYNHVEMEGGLLRCTSVDSVPVFESSLISLYVSFSLSLKLISVCNNVHLTKDNSPKTPLTHVCEGAGKEEKD